MAVYLKGLTRLLELTWILLTPLGDTIDAGSGCEASVTARIRAAWGKFRQLLPLLTSRGLSLHTRGKIYSTYICPVLLYASESWAPNVFNIAKLQRNDRCMTRWNCNTKQPNSVITFH